MALIIKAALKACGISQRNFAAVAHLSSTQFNLTINTGKFPSDAGGFSAGVERAAKHFPALVDYMATRELQPADLLQRERRGGTPDQAGAPRPLVSREEHFTCYNGNPKLQPTIVLCQGEGVIGGGTVAVLEIGNGGEEAGPVEYLHPDDLRNLAAVLLAAAEAWPGESA